MEIRADFLVIGSGVAGLSFALEASGYGNVVVLSKKAPDDTNTNIAQGGMACVVDPSDCQEMFVKNCTDAGVGLCRLEAVTLLAEKCRDATKFLIGHGVRFTENSDGSFDLGQEGGHSKRRILHADDMTGREIQRALLQAARKNPNIQILDRHIAIDLILQSKLNRRKTAPQEPDVCWGAFVLDCGKNEIYTVAAKATILATGGAGKVYLYTTNSDVATGDGVAMAYRAGASVANMEFYQFHPTCLYHPKAKSFLISEALRGEGGILKLANGTPFMAKYSEMKELAPRDIVARSIDQEMKETGEECVFLDISHRPADFIRQRFPNIHQKCLEYGIDCMKEPIPVVPAAHYMCGGVMTNLRGETDIRRLFACGETAYTGIHGANRLASTSLLEGVVFGRIAAGRAAEFIHDSSALPPLPMWDCRGMVQSDETVVVTHTWDEIRRFMWNYVGIVRSESRLLRAKRRLDLAREEISDYYWKFFVTSDLVELRNILTVADLIVNSALLRKESRGLHSMVNYPARDDYKWKKETVLRREPGSV
jgi:L-aspartate oxidase